MQPTIVEEHVYEGSDNLNLARIEDHAGANVQRAVITSWDLTVQDEETGSLVYSLPSPDQRGHGDVVLVRHTPNHRRVGRQRPQGLQHAPRHRQRDDRQRDPSKGGGPTCSNTSSRRAPLALSWSSSDGSCRARPSPPKPRKVSTDVLYRPHPPTTATSTRSRTPATPSSRRSQRIPRQSPGSPPRSRCLTSR